MDVDIDIDPRVKPETVFPKWVKASVVQNGELRPHPVGFYPQAMAKDPITGFAAIPFDVAEDLGYLKVDFLNLNVYRNFNSRDEINELLKKEPDWNLMQIPSNQIKLFQLAKHGDLIKDIKPKSIMEVADCMALIRPAKRFLVPFYKKDKKNARILLWRKDEDGGYAFKKSHAVGYAYVIWLQLHLMEQGKL